MGSTQHHPVEVDPQALANARHMWGFFTQAIKYSVISIIVLLLLMALFLV